MSDYVPDGWCILKMPTDYYRIFGGFAGGYAQGDSWKFSSAIVELTREDGQYTIRTFSGSEYVLTDSAENRFTAWCDSILQQIIEIHSAKIVPIDEVICYVETNIDEQGPV